MSRRSCSSTHILRQELECLKSLLISGQTTGTRSSVLKNCHSRISCTTSSPASGIEKKQMSPCVHFPGSSAYKHTHTHELLQCHQLPFTEHAKSRQVARNPSHMKHRCLKKPLFSSPASPQAKGKHVPAGSPLPFVLPIFLSCLFTL